MKSSNMEDKHRHIDKAFTDHAWAEMHRLLDEEMPAPGKRKRRLGWWWTLAFIGLLACGAGAAFYSQKTVEEAKTKTHEHPVALLENEDGNSSESDDYLMSEDHIKTDSQKSIDKMESLKNSSTNKNTSTNPVVKKSPQVTDNQQFTQKENTLPLPAFEPEKNEGKLVAEVQPTETFSQKHQDKESQAMELSVVEKVEKPPLTDLPVIVVQPDVKTKFPPRHKFGWSAYASTFATPKNSGSGLGGGILVDHRIKDSRFSVQSGLGYTYLVQPLDVVYIRPITDDNENPVGEGNGSGGIGGDIETPSSIGQSYADAYVLFNAKSSSSSLRDQVVANGGTRTSDDQLHLHYVQVPLEINYRRGRWQAHAGTHAGLLLSSKSRFASGGIFSSDNKADENAFGGANLEANQTFGSKVKRFDFAAVGGIGFDISPRFGFDLNYRMGLVDLVKDNNGNKDYNRFFQATMRYRIR